MSRKRYTAEQIIGHLRQAEIRTSEGKTIAEAVREASSDSYSTTVEKEKDLARCSPTSTGSRRRRLPA